MKQHPVPQHIASYQFRLIGQMTLKQFLELAGGIVVAGFIYSLDIVSIIKWPIVFISGLGGAALAFLPFEERPLDKWISNFFKSIYSPTQYIWKKENKPLAIFTKQRRTIPIIAAKKPLVTKSRSNIDEYLKTLPEYYSKIQPLEKKENEKMLQISKLLGYEQTKPIPFFKSVAKTPSPIAATKTKRTVVRKLRPSKDVNIPTIKTIRIEKKEASTLSYGQTDGSEPIIGPAPPLAPPILVESQYHQKLDPAVAAQFSTTLPIPQTPDVPNLLVGMILNHIDKIVPNALIEIIDEDGETVRAFKSNKLGQFFSASPLNKGKYQIKVEHPDYNFDIIEFKAEGKIILPMKIKAKKRKEN